MNITVTDKKTGKPQHFEVRMAHTHFVQTIKIISRDGYCPDTADLTSLKENIKNVRESYLSSLKIMPLTEEGVKFDQYHRSNYHYRGYKQNYSQTIPQQDPDSFVVRGKKMPMVSAHIWKDADTGQMEIRFLSEDSNHIITEKQSEELKDRFKEELLLAVPLVLETVKQETIEYMIAYAKQDIDDILARIKDLKEFNG